MTKSVVSIHKSPSVNNISLQLGEIKRGLKIRIYLKQTTFLGFALEDYGFKSAVDGAQTPESASLVHHFKHQHTCVYN